jgi:hypothetical protein
MKPAALVLGALAVVPVFLAPELREAAACSCMGPHTEILSPDRLDDAPLNTRVRIEMPGPGVAAVLRVHGGAEAPTTSRAISAGHYTILELLPKVPLAASSQYEVAMITPNAHPGTHVIATFKTGTTSDTVPPKLDKIGVAAAHRNSMYGGGSCAIPGPWVDVEGLGAEDPGRPAAQLFFGVWQGDAAGRIDATKPPATILRAHKGAIRIGAGSLCDPRHYPLPQSGVTWFGIAALDEAGNASPMKKVKVDLTVTP